MGQWYTWERGNSPETRIRERLYRFLVSLSWLQFFPDAYIEHLVRYKSDHAAIMLRGEGVPRPRRQSGVKGFRFETSWLLEEGCEDAVRKAWTEAAGTSVPARIVAVAQGLVGWSKVGGGNFAKQIDKVEKALHAAQRAPVSQASCDRCIDLEHKLDDLHAKNEVHWYMRSRVADVKDGDRNTKYYHHKASQRKRRNTIKGIYDDSGIWQTEEEKIEGEVETYFRYIFSSINPSEGEYEEVLKHVSHSVSRQFNDDLMRPYSKEEIYTALCQMHPCKAPGPDGMHAIFYQGFWHIIGDEVVEFVCNILHGDSFPADLNCTNIALIPKIASPKFVSDFRPISLCNVLYKIASKALVMRLKNILPAIVTEN